MVQSYRPIGLHWVSPTLSASLAAHALAQWGPSCVIVGSNYRCRHCLQVTILCSLLLSCAHRFMLRSDQTGKTDQVESPVWHVIWLAYLTAVGLCARERNHSLLTQMTGSLSIVCRILPIRKCRLCTSFFFFFSFIKWKLQSPQWRWQYILGPPVYRTAYGLREWGLARFPLCVAHRGGRTAADVLLSDCQYHRGTAVYGRCGV